MFPSTTPVTVIGAGPVGVTQAMLLARAGQRVQVLEGRQDPRQPQASGGRSINLTLAHRAFRTFDALGVGDEIRRICVRCRGRYVHGDDGSVRFHPYGPREQDALYAVSRMGLLRKLLDLASPQAGIDFRFTHRCLSMDLQGAPRLFIDRPEGGAPYHLEAERVISADGLSSVARSTLLAHERYDVNVRYANVLYRELSIPVPQGGEGALAPDGLHIWPRGEAMLVAIPNLDQSHSCVLFLPLEGKHGFEATRTPAGLLDLIGTLFPDVAHLLPELRHDFFRRPASLLCSSVIAPLRYRDRVVLVGDAARSVVPFLGQGLNAGLEDALLLTSELEGAGGDWEAAFARYEQARVPDSLALQELAFEHYQELAVRARQPDFILRKRVEQRIQALFPLDFESVYSMVSFSSRPYAECARHRAFQEQVLARLLGSPGVSDRLQTDAFAAEAAAALQWVRRGAA